MMETRKKMKTIAIHNRKNSFSDDWIRYCEDNNIPFKLVDCYSNDIFEQIEDCDALMWHWDHMDHAASLFARQLTYSLEKMGKKVFPDLNTCRFFDDKIGQKYLFEALGVPHVPTYIFYDKQKALEWVEKAEFPKVFKLSKGAGSANVRLVKSKEEAEKLIKTAFGKGFKPVASYFSDISRRVKKKKTITDMYKALIRMPESIYAILMSNLQMNREKGYVYFQDFIPDNTFDIRVVTVGNKAIALKRLCQKNDFRASGSGRLIYDKNQIDEKCVKIAFDVSKKAGFQAMAYDFVFVDKNPVLIETSYAVSHRAYDNCEGHWTSDIKWNKEKKIICYEMIEALLEMEGEQV